LLRAPDGNQNPRIVPAAEPAETPQTPTGAERPATRASVLIVDDDAFHRATLGEMMSEQGHQVREAADGSSALEAVAEERFSHVFLEVHLPGLGGIELARLIRERAPRTVTILMSA